jgi:DGQHR domain-containing protein
MIEQQNSSQEQQSLRFTFSLITQGIYRFYTLTLESDLLARICFVTTREEDPKLGFQRVLDKKRAQEIANYIDSGLGTIPSSIVLSARPEAELTIIKGGKILEFVDRPRSFLILDGQHRVYGFSLAKSKLRVPVVIYNNLSRQEESRLFIDINTKQRPVPNELLLDIKRLAEYETDSERLLMEIFDLFNEDPNSPLLGKLSPTQKATNKLTRVNFKASVSPLINAFTGKQTEEVYEVLRNYLKVFISEMIIIDAEDTITKPTVFRAVMLLFNDVGQRVQDLHGRNYSTDNFYDVLKPMFNNVSQSWFINPKSFDTLYKKFRGALKNFTL